MLQKTGQLYRYLSRHILQWLCDHVWTLFDSQTPLFHIQLDITNACNLKCGHCYCPHHQNSGALTFEQWVLVLDKYKFFIEELCMKPVITLCGGEPLVCPFLLPLLHKIRDKFPHCDLSVQSNGTLISENLAREFKSLNVSVQISFDGPDAEKHDFIRGKGSFQKSFTACEVLRKAGVVFTYQAVLSQRTKSWIKDFFNLAKSTGAAAMNFTRLIVEGHAKILTADGIDSVLKGNDLKKAYQEILGASREVGIFTSTHGALWHLIEEGLGSPNNIGFNGCVIGYKGEIKVSSRTTAVLGNILNDDLGDVFMNHEILKKLRDGEIAGCGACSHFKKCRGDRNISFVEFGHFFGPDTGCWVLNQQERKDVL